MQVGVMTQRLARDVVHKILHFIKFMEQKNIANCFNYNDVFIDKITGHIKIDSYGDFHHFVIKQEPSPSSIWELGTLLFALLKGHPPYTNNTQNDVLYKCLKKEQFKKFWQMINPKPVQNPSQTVVKFLNKCFQKQSKFQTLEIDSWLNNFQPLTIQEKTQEIALISQIKQQKRASKQQKNRQRKQNMKQAARERQCASRVRGTYPQVLECFLDYLFIEQQKSRPLKKRQPNLQNNEQYDEKIRVQIAELLTILKTNMNEDKDVVIYDVRDKKDAIVFKIKTEIGGIILIDSQVEIAIQIHNNSVKFVTKKIEGNFYQSKWISNYLEELVPSI